VSKPKGPKSRNIVIDWSDVKDRYIASVEKGENWPTQPAMNDRLLQYGKNPYQKDDWGGGSGADTLKYLREGFHAPEFSNSAEYVPTANKMRNTWNMEEGDVDIFRMSAGRDDFYLGPQKRLSKPGVRIQIEFAFAAMVSSKTIQEYGAWCAGFIGALETEGYDLVVDMWIPLDNLFEGDGGGYYDDGDGDKITRSNVLVRVKRPNEVSDFTEWSSLFGPTGYRHLGFTAKCVAGDKIGKRANGSLGMTLGDKSWGVEYDKDEALVMITCNQRAGGSERLPKEHMNKQARECGLLPGLEG
jgi:hypothetical protein